MAEKNYSIDPETDADQPISKTKLKRDADAAQNIGKKLIDLSKDRRGLYGMITVLAFTL